MNDPEAESVREQQVRLERATSPTYEDTSDLDEQTSGLRDSWLGLTTLLNASDKELDSRALPTLELPPRRKTPWIAVSLWTSAALVLVAFVGMYWTKARSTLVDGPNLDPHASEITASPYPRNLPPRISAHLSPMEVGENDTQLLWNDPWEEHATLAQDGFIQLNLGLNWLDDSFHVLSYQLELIDDELAEEAL